MSASRRLTPSLTRQARSGFWHGFVVVVSLAGLALCVGSVIPVSSLVVGLAAGALWANTVGVAAAHREGTRFAATALLRVGIVILGLRLSLGDLAEIGVPVLVVVTSTVVLTFFGTQALGRRMRLGRDISLLVATGFAICGVSAIAAVEPATDATEEEVAASIGLVVVFGFLAMLSIPAAARGLGLDDVGAGAWIGASTHDVAQVVAGASSVGAAAVPVAVVVKLTRVALLAPVVAGVNIARRHRRSEEVVDGDPAVGRSPILPLFVVGFLAAVALRTTGWLSSGVLDIAGLAEKALLTAAMVGLGAGVRFQDFRALGARPLVLGATSWLVVSGVSLVGVVAVT